MLKKTVYFFILAVVLAHGVFVFSRLNADEQKNKEIISQLLKHSIPPEKDWVKQAEEINHTLPPGKRWYKNGPVGDDAPIEILVDYWFELQDSSFRTLIKDDGGQLIAKVLSPSYKAQIRLLRFCETHPEYLRRNINKFYSREAITIIKTIYDMMLLNKDDYEKALLETIYLYLLHNSDYYIDDLVKKANNLNLYSGYLEFERVLRALVRFDWESAQPILMKFSSVSNIEKSSLSLTLLYKHAVSVGNKQDVAILRKKLCRIVEDRDASLHARKCACQVLFASPRWQGWKEWYLSLFKDPTFIIHEDDDEEAYKLLEIPVIRNPEEWIPRLAELVESNNRTVRDNAVNCLSSFTLNNTRSDALRLLLPWLSNPEWTRLDVRKLFNIIKSLCLVELPQCVPGMIWLIKNKPDGYSEIIDDYYDIEEEHIEESISLYAIKAAKKYKVKQVIPELKNEIDQFSDSDIEHNAYFKELLATVLELGGFSDEEIVSYIEAYASYWASENKQKTKPAKIGDLITDVRNDSKSLTTKVFSRVKELKKNKPDVAEAFLSQVTYWPSHAGARWIVDCILSGEQMNVMIGWAIARREIIRTHFGGELRDSVRKGGINAGIWSIILEDEGIIHSLLKGNDVQAQRALIACAIIAGKSLPISLIEKLLKGKDKSLSDMAEQYLYADDSPEAREILKAYHPGEILIFGNWPWYTNDCDDSGFCGKNNRMHKIESQLLEEMKSDNGPEEIYFMKHGIMNCFSGWSEIDCAIYQYKDKIVFVKGSSKITYINCSKEEFDNFKQFVCNNKIDDLENLASDIGLGVDVRDYTNSYYIHLTKESGYRLFIEKQASIHDSSDFRLYIQNQKASDFDVNLRLGTLQDILTRKYLALFDEQLN